MKFQKPKTRSLRYMNRFDALELHACIVIGTHMRGGKKIEDIEQDDDEKKPAMFSVYGHFREQGGVNCLEDFERHADAVKWMKKEAARCKFELGYEDYWCHGKQEQSPTGAELAKLRRLRAEASGDRE